MEAKLLYDRNGLRTFALVFQKDDEVQKGLLEFAKTNRSNLSAIGAFSEVTLGFFDRQRKQYMQDTDQGTGRGAVFYGQHRAKRR